ncbi:MAG: hypothetical protein M1133_04375 [Armatimonadetes bacterium]|nr:hypothetical protein [Armatimonadota bacterium]
MSDRKSLAIVLGAFVGAAAVTATVVYYKSHHHEEAARSVNEIFDRARQTVRKLDEAVDILRKSAEA